MDRRALPALLLAVLLCGLPLSRTTAQVGPPQPVPPPTKPPQPAGPYLGGVFGYPFDFRFAAQIFGGGFHPGERVTVSGEHVSLSPVVVNADASGAFAIRLSFSWVFCGPRGTIAPAPVFHASGDAGSAAALTPQPPPCPELVSRAQLAGPPPESGGAGGVVSSGTAVAGTAVAVGTVQPVPPGTGVDVTPQPPSWLTQPRVVSFDILGFGFAPGEHVAVHESVPAGMTALPAVQTTADGQGRLSFSMQAYVPPRCGPAAPFFLVATGDQGTSVTSPLQWADPIMIPCYVGPPGPGTPVPPGVPGVPEPQPASADAAGAQVSLSLHPTAISPGGREQASVSSDQSGAVHLTVRYPRRGKTVRNATATAGRQLRIRWRVPRAAGRGRAQVSLTQSPGHVALRTTLQIR